MKREEEKTEEEKTSQRDAGPLERREDAASGRTATAAGRDRSCARIWLGIGLRIAREAAHSVGASSEMASGGATNRSTNEEQRNKTVQKQTRQMQQYYGSGRVQQGPASARTQPAPAAAITVGGRRKNFALETHTGGKKTSPTATSRYPKFGQLSKSGHRIQMAEGQIAGNGGYAAGGGRWCEYWTCRLPRRVVRRTSHPAALKHF